MMLEIIQAGLIKELQEAKIQIEKQEKLEIVLSMKDKVDEVKVHLLGNEKNGIAFEIKGMMREVMIVSYEQLELILKAKKQQDEYLDLAGIKDSFIKEKLKEIMFQALMGVRQEIHKGVCPHCGVEENIPMSIGITSFNENTGLRVCENCNKEYKVLVTRDESKKIVKIDTEKL